MAKTAVRIGSIATDVLDDVKSGFFLATADQYDSMTTGGATKYVVPTGKRFIISKLFQASTGASGRVILGYGDNPVTDSATPPTNFVAIATSFLAEVANKSYEHSVFYSIPAGKYPCILGLTAAQQINAFGKEVAV